MSPRENAVRSCPRRSGTNILGEHTACKRGLRQYRVGEIADADHPDIHRRPDGQTRRETRFSREKERSTLRATLWRNLEHGMLNARPDTKGQLFLGPTDTNRSDRGESAETEHRQVVAEGRGVQGSFLGGGRGVGTSSGTRGWRWHTTSVLCAMDLYPFKWVKRRSLLRVFYHNKKSVLCKTKALRQRGAHGNRSRNDSFSLSTFKMPRFLA